MEGATIIFLLCGDGVVGWGAVMLSQEVAHRWRVRQRQRMTREQRRVDAALEQPPEFGVIPTR